LKEEGTSTTDKLEPIADKEEKTKEPEDLGLSPPIALRLPSIALNIGMCIVLPYGVQNALIFWHKRSHDSKREMEDLSSKDSKDNLHSKTTGYKKVKCLCNLLILSFAMVSQFLNKFA